MRVLLIEDERNMADFVIKGLKSEHFAVDWAQKREKGLSLINKNIYDLGILDINLGEGESESGIDICKEIRDRGKHFPIIMLSVTNDAHVKVQALNLGADDYLTKPFATVELIARIRALMRREKRIMGPKLKVANLEMDTMAHTVRVAGKEIRLNRKEFALLEFLMRSPGTTMTRNMILEHVWDMNADPFTNTVDVHIRLLRSKIDDTRRGKKLIKTVHGYGYKIEG